MQGPADICLGETGPLSINHEGWIDTSDPAKSVVGNGVSDEPASGPTYRILVDWDGYAEEAEWTQQFAHSPRMYGFPSQMIALCVDRVVAKRVQFVMDELYMLRDGNEVSESDEDMGF